MRWFEDLKVGETRRFGAYEVTREEVLAFAEAYDPQPFHLSDEAAAQTHFGRLAASGWHTCAMTMRMLVDAGREDPYAGLGSPGVDELRWLRPVFPGDVLSVEMTVTELRASRSKPDLGTLHSDVRVFNADGDAVMTFKSIVLVRRRPEQGAT